jgi:biopolymer transport protein ExbB/TolQ
MNAIIVVTDIIEKLVLLLLLGLSIWSITIMIDRKRFFKMQISESQFLKIKKMISEKQFSFLSLTENNFYLNSFQSAEKYSDSFKKQNSIDRAISSFIKDERGNLEKGLPVLATLGANAPFIGLFGTVLGIIRSFAYLGSQSGSAAVMSGVSQALYATAVGLVVAIPAVVAYNYFSNQIKRAIQRTESLRDLMMAQISKENN